MTVIDIKTFDELRQVSGADFLNELIDAFLDDAPKMIQQIRTALTNKDVESFRRNAHSLKSNAKTFGATGLAELSMELESIGRDNRLDAVGDRLEKLSVEYARVETALKGMRNA